MSTKDSVETGPYNALAAALDAPMQAVSELINARMTSQHVALISQITQHLFDAGGKRLRPMLTLAAARMCDYSGPYDVYLATTVEFIHTATLLHDDVVDESNQRRGRPTANLLWDNKSSVLVGDFLFSRSFQLMTETGNIEVLRILSDASATISEGEVLQMSAAQDLNTSNETYLEIVRGKTAALFSAAAQVGGVIADAPPAHVRALYEYGDALGIAFQITDDLLDYQGTALATGKNMGDDFRERKLSLPVIKALAVANATERAFWARTIEEGQQDDTDFARAREILSQRGALDATRQDALDWADRARCALDPIPAHPLKDILIDLAGYVVARIS